MIKRYNEGYKYVSQNKTIKIKDTDYVVGELIDGMQDRLTGSEFDVDDYTQHEEGERYYDRWEDTYNNKVAKGCSELTFMVLDYDGEIPRSDLADAIKGTVNCFDRAEFCHVKVEHDSEAQSMIREYGRGGNGWRAYVSIKWKADTKKLFKKAKEDFAKWLEEDGKYYLSYYEDESEKLDAATELLEKWATDWYYDNFDRKAFRDMADLDGAIKAGTSESLLAQALEYVENQMAQNESKIIRTKPIQEKTSRRRRLGESRSKNSICGEREYKEVSTGLADDEQLAFMARKLYRIGLQYKNYNYDRDYNFKEYLQLRDFTHFGEYPEFDWSEFYDHYEVSHSGPGPDNPYVKKPIEVWDAYVWNYLRKLALVHKKV